MKSGGADWGPTPTCLSGAHVELQPLTAAHRADLFEASQEPEIWLYMPAPQPASEADVQAFIDRALDHVAKREAVVFAIIDRRTGRAVGSTRYSDIVRNDRGLEIGWTWLGRSARRTPINTECKYLLLRHAFEGCEALRVQLKCDDRNERSKAAIRRIGATFEGVLRCHRVMWDGYLRDSAYFSVVHREWPAVRAALEAKLAR